MAATARQGGGCVAHLEVAMYDVDLRAGQELEAFQDLLGELSDEVQGHASEACVLNVCVCVGGGGARRVVWGGGHRIRWGRGARCE